MVHDSTVLDSLHLTDDMEFYVHPTQEGKYIPYPKELEHDWASVCVLIREWDPETWQLSPIREIQVPKTLRAGDFGKYMQA